MEIFNNDHDELCLSKLLYIFSDLGYNLRPLTPGIIEVLFDSLDNACRSMSFIDMLVSNKIVGLSECEDIVNLLFAPDDKTVYFMNFKNANLIDNYVNKI